MRGIWKGKRDWEVMLRVWFGCGCDGFFGGCECSNVCEIIEGRLSTIFSTVWLIFVWIGLIETFNEFAYFGGFLLVNFVLIEH